MKTLSLVLSISMIYGAARPQCAAENLGSVAVAGTEVVYFAGRTQDELSAIFNTVPDGEPRILDLSQDIGDIAVTSPSIVNVSGYRSISISAGGLWSHFPGLNPPGATGPDGRSDTSPTAPRPVYGVFGVSLIEARLNTLVGVFLSDELPDPDKTPATLSVAAGDGMTNPLLNQTFNIGSNLDDILVPPGASRLSLGMHDAWGWNNNAGSVTATITGIVPEPSSGILALSGVTLVGMAMRRLRHS